MAFKLMTFAALVAVASAGVLPGAPLAYHAANIAPLTYSHSGPVAYAAPVAKAVYAETHDNEYDSHPQYSYSYDVHDSLTGDAKSQQETRNGDAVEGSYSFVEADGSRRVVHYTADDQNGFNAVVEKQPAQVAVKTVSPVVYQSASPVVKTVSPVVYQSAGPIVKAVSPVVYQSAGPVVKTVSPLAYQAATPVVKTVAPVAHATYAAPAYYQHSSPLYNVAAPLTRATYAAPLYHH